jgi:hypothetical protein
MIGPVESEFSPLARDFLPFTVQRAAATSPDDNIYCWETPEKVNEKFKEGHR